ELRQQLDARPRQRAVLGRARRHPGVWNAPIAENRAHLPAVRRAGHPDDVDGLGHGYWFITDRMRTRTFAGTLPSGTSMRSRRLSPTRMSCASVPSGPVRVTRITRPVL